MAASTSAARLWLNAGELWNGPDTSAISWGSCIIDGEAVACGDDGIAVFELIRRWRNGGSALLYAFDLIELNGDDLRRDPLERRKAALERLLARTGVRHAAQ